MANRAPSPQNFNPIVIIGIGNEFRGDDGAGLAAAELLKAEKLTGVETKKLSGEGALLLDAWQGYETSIVIDAARGGAIPGTIHKFDIFDKPLPRGMFNSCSSHAFSLVEAIEMGKMLGTLPKNLIVYGIEGKSFSMGLGLSDEIQEGVRKLVAQLKAELVN